MYISTQFESESITTNDLDDKKSKKSSRSYISNISVRPPSNISFIHKERPIIKLSTRRQKEAEEDNISYSKYYESVSAFNENDHLKDGRVKSFRPVEKNAKDDNSSMSIESGLDKLIT